MQSHHLGPIFVENLLVLARQLAALVDSDVQVLDRLQRLLWVDRNAQLLKAVSVSLPLVLLFCL